MRSLALAATLLAACATPTAPQQGTADARRSLPVAASAVAEAGRVAGVDVWAVTGPCPVPGSPAWRDDLAIVLWVQQARTPEEVRRAAAEVEQGPEAFSDAAGAAIDAAHRPLTLALLAEAARQARGVYGPLKAHCDRARPYADDARVAPAVPKEPTPAFPSGHATRGALFGRLLAELAPAHADALLERGRQYGYDRVRAGVHWPSDVDAGRKLGAALAEAWLKRPEFRARVEEVRRAEWRTP